MAAWRSRADTTAVPVLSATPNGSPADCSHSTFVLVSGGSPALSTVYTVVRNHTDSTPDSGATTSPAGPGAVSPYTAIRRGSRVPGRSAAHGDTGCRRTHRC